MRNSRTCLVSSYKNSFDIGSFSDDPGSGLACILFAVLRGELLLHFGVCARKHSSANGADAARPWVMKREHRSFGFFHGDSFPQAGFDCYPV
jgi:hypothetical protein